MVNIVLLNDRGMNGATKDKSQSWVGPLEDLQSCMMSTLGEGLAVCVTLRQDSQEPGFLAARGMPR